LPELAAPEQFNAQPSRRKGTHTRMAPGYARIRVLKQPFGELV
jgi:hypothetical protein